MPAKGNARTRELGRIHILKKELGLDEDQYRVMLHLVADGAESAKDLDASGRQAVIKHLQAHVTRGKKPHSYPGRPNNADASARAEISKIEALLTDAGKPWSYAEGIMRRVTYGRKQRLEFCDQAELRAIIAALERNALKRLHAACEATFGKFWPNCVSDYAELLLDFPAMRRDVATCSQTMSTILRWWNGETQLACAWPVADGAQARACTCCRRRAGYLA